MNLVTVAFALLAGLLIVYAILDGFDLGVGVLSMLARSREERDLHYAAVGPVWDGNEVWLLASGNVLFGAFPLAFAVVCNGLYLALMLLLLALTARAVAIEFRRHPTSARWVAGCDAAFALGSLVPVLLYGVVAGNVLRGVPIGPGFAWHCSLRELLNPYALLVGLASCALFMTHGALFLRVNREGELSERFGRIALAAHAAFVVLFGAAFAATAWVSPSFFRKAGSPIAWALALALILALATVPAATRRGKARLAFLASCAAIALLIATAALATYPVLLPSSLMPEHSLTVYNAASTPGTLAAILAIACVGLPIVVGYTALVYRAFSGGQRSAPPPVDEQDAAESLVEP